MKFNLNYLKITRKLFAKGYVYNRNSFTVPFENATMLCFYYLSNSFSLKA